MARIDETLFLRLLRKHAKTADAAMKDVLFGGGLNISSIRFTEFIMELEEDCDLEIDIDDLDACIRTVQQLYSRIANQEA